jgi:gamma-glutamyl:cysteine ligase YbdK (ATP-grasp superfamily)
MVAAEIAIAQLWAELEPDLAEHGEHQLLEQLLARLLRTGTSAARQRRTFAATGSLQEVARQSVRLTAAQQ